MSFAALQWERRQKVGNGIAKALLHRFADWANADGESYYGFETIVREVEFTPRAVRNAIDFLIVHGWLEKRTRTAGKGKCLSPLWRVTMIEPSPCEIAPADPPPLSPCESAPPTPVSPCENDNLAPADSPPKPLRGSKKEKRSASRSISARAGVREKPHVFPPDWEPTEEDRAYAIEHGRNPDLCRDSMRNYWPGRRTKRPGWSATFRNYVLMCESSGRFPLHAAPDRAEKPKFRNGFVQLVAERIERENAWADNEFLQRKQIAEEVR